MTKTNFFSAIALLSALQFSAQEKVIDTVAIFDKRLSEASKTQQIYKISAADILKNPTNLSETLRFQTPVYIKENGRGAASSPSFRGTTAQQTSFLWNGIPVNSIFLGQGDINNLSLLNYDQIDVKAGGGSVEYGSAAIGGSIHLNNSLNYNRGFGGKLFAEYGSFGTMNTSLKTAYSNENFSAIFSAGVVKSDNDYTVPEKNYTNLNGEYSNQTFNLSLGYRFGAADKVYWHTQQFFGDQHFPIFEAQQTRTKYIANSFRSLAGWEKSGIRYRNELDAAWLEERFSYYPNISKPRESGGLGRTLYFKDDFGYDLRGNFKLKIYSLVKQERGEGYQSGIKNPERWSGSVATLLQFDAGKLFLEAGAKKEFVQKTSAPFLYSFGGRYKVGEVFSVKFKGSKNFRYPSFNDLYWHPGGNPGLRPEISYQAEMTPQVSFKNFALSVTGYYNGITDMIRWVPTSAGFWAPENTNKVKINGLEVNFNFNKNFGEHYLSGNLGYAYTKSENAETGYQLNYVPLQKAFGTVNYRWKLLEIFVQGMYNGQTFTTTNESTTDDLEPYFVLNAGIGATVFKNYKLGFRVQNITDAVYETTAYYPLPKRNYSVNLMINF